MKRVNFGPGGHLGSTLCYKPASGILCYVECLFNRLGAFDEFRVEGGRRSYSICGGKFRPTLIFTDVSGDVLRECDFLSHLRDSLWFVILRSSRQELRSRRRREGCDGREGGRQRGGFPTTDRQTGREAKGVNDPVVQGESLSF